MSKLIKIGIFAFLVYLVITNAPAWIERVTDVGSDISRSSGGVGQGACVPAAERTSEAFGRGLRDFGRPPIDLGSWELFMENVKGQIYDAESICSCPMASCSKSLEALTEVTLLVEDFDASLRSSGAPLNPGRRQETIDRLLRRARELDRQGS